MIYVYVITQVLSCKKQKMWRNFDILLFSPSDLFVILTFWSFLDFIDQIFKQKAKNKEFLCVCYITVNGIYVDRWLALRHLSLLDALNMW